MNPGISRTAIAVFLVVLLAAMAFCLRGCGGSPAIPADSVPMERHAQIWPEYEGVTIPPNIAPLNFRIKETGRRYIVTMGVGTSTPISIGSANGSIQIPHKSWAHLLTSAAGNPIRVTIYMQSEKSWKRFPEFFIHVAPDPIDPYLTYRLLRPQYNKFHDVGIYQRNLEGFDQREILHGRHFRNGCVNCHQLNRNHPGTLMFGVRTSVFGSGTILIQDGEIDKIGTNFGHTTWHPTGKVVAYSMFDVRMFFHTTRNEVRDVVEFDSLLGSMKVDGNKTTTVPALADKEQLETQPYWSPDGRYLYFASAPKLWKDSKRYPPDLYAQLKYDIKRVSYDLNTDTWGQPETIVSAAQFGLSCLGPRVSPDGRWLLFSACEYGCFAIYQPSSDLYVMNLETREIHKLECNSDFVDSWHSWSANSRWIAFSSKRPTGQFTRVYFAYIDESGKSHKPFLLPQKDPRFYDSFLYAYNVPELAVWKIDIDKKKLLDAIRSKPTIQVDAITTPTPKEDSLPGKPYQDGVR